MRRWTPDDVLGTTSPRELFGEEAAETPVALRRAYATLIRHFGPDEHPDVFEHVRALYERAKAGDFGGGEAILESSGEAIGAEAASNPVEALRMAMNARDGGAVGEILSRHSLDIAPVAPDIWLDACVVAVMLGGLGLSTDDAHTWLGTVRSLPFDDRLDPEHIDFIEEGTSLVLDLATARRDPKVDPRWLDAVVETWGRSPAERLERWLQLAEALAPEPTQDSLRYVERHHPGVYCAIERTSRVITGADDVDATVLAGQHPGIPALEVPGEIRRCFEPGASAGTFILRWLNLMGALLVVGIGTIPFAIFIKLVSPESRVVVPLIIMVLAVSAPMVRATKLRRKALGLSFLAYLLHDLGPNARRNPGFSAVPLVWLRETGFWPHELILAITPLNKTRDELSDFTSDHPLLRFEQDLGLLPYALGPAHLERRRAEQARAEAEAEAEYQSQVIE